VLDNDEPVPNELRLFVIDVPNNDDVAGAGLVFPNNDGELLAGNVETPVCPNIVVLEDDVNGLELLNEVIVGEGLGANGLFGFVAGGLNGLLVGAKAFCCDDGKLGAAAGVPEGFGPPLSPR